MNKQKEVSDVDAQLQKNKDNTTLLQKRLKDIQQEEDLYREDLCSCTKSIENLSTILQGAVLVKIQMEAYSDMDELRHNVENAFQEEHEHVENRLRLLSREQEELALKKESLQEEQDK